MALVAHKALMGLYKPSVNAKAPKQKGLCAPRAERWRRVAESSMAGVVVSKTSQHKKISSLPRARSLAQAVASRPSSHFFGGRRKSDGRTRCALRSWRWLVWHWLYPHHLRSLPIRHSSCSRFEHGRKLRLKSQRKSYSLCWTRQTFEMSSWPLHRNFQGSHRQHF